MARSIDESNIVLTGFMGTGKTTVGRLLAERLGLLFVDTDELIEERHGPIPDIFQNRGEAAFRAFEREVVLELAGLRGLVISTGGRLMLDAENASTLGQTGPVFCLVAKPDTILRRVGSGVSTSQRPLLAGDDPLERIVTLLEDRKAGYGRFLQVETEWRSPAEVVDELVERIESELRQPSQD